MVNFYTDGTNVLFVYSYKKPFVFSHNEKLKPMSSCALFTVWAVRSSVEHDSTFRGALTKKTQRDRHKQPLSVIFINNCVGWRRWFITDCMSFCACPIYWRHPSNGFLIYNLRSFSSWISVKLSFEGAWPCSRLNFYPSSLSRE